MSLPKAQPHSATNASIKLLTLAASPPSLHLKQPITNLQDLGNRLAMANSKYKDQKGEHEARKWLLAQEIDLSKIIEAAKTLKRSDKAETKPEVESWESLQFESLENHKDTLYFQQYEERIAHTAISQAFSRQQANYMNDLLTNLRDSICGKRETVEIREMEAFIHPPVLHSHQFLRIYAEKDIALTDITYACDDEGMDESLKQIFSLLQCQAKAAEQASKKEIMVVTRQQLKRGGKLKLTKGIDTNLSKAEQLISKHGNNDSQFDKNSKMLVQKCVNECINNPDKLTETIKIILSLGKYKYLVNLYNERGQNKPIFIFLFIALAYHYELLHSSTQDTKDKISPKTSQVLLEFIDKIAEFAAAHKKDNSLEFYSLLLYLLLILRKLTKFAKHFEQLPQQLALTLQIKMVDLQQIDCDFVYKFVESNSLGKALIKEILWRMTPKTCQDYLLLANVSKGLEVPDIFIKFILERQMKDSTEREEQSEQLFVGSIQLAEIDEETMQQIKEGLFDSLSDGNKRLFFFIEKLKEVKKLTKMRRSDHLLEQRKEIERFLENYKVLDELRQLSVQREVNYFDLYVSYYQEVQKMYKIIHAKAAGQLRQKYRELRSQVQNLQARYLMMASPRLQRLMLLLQ